MQPAPVHAEEPPLNRGRGPVHPPSLSDQHAAATKVQSAVRGRNGRLEASTLRQQSTQRANEAATQIQAVVRGRAVRREIATNQAITKFQAIVRGGAVRTSAVGKGVNEHMNAYRDSLPGPRRRQRQSPRDDIQKQMIDRRAEELRESVGTSWRHSPQGALISIKQNARRVAKSLPRDPLNVTTAYEREESARVQARNSLSNGKSVERPNADTRRLAARMAQEGTSWKYGVSGAKVSAAQQLRKLGQHLPGWGRMIKKKRQEIEEARKLAREPDAETSALIGNAIATREQNALDRVATPSLANHAQMRAEKAALALASKLVPTNKAAQRLKASSSTLAGALEKADRDDEAFHTLAEKKLDRRAEATLGAMSPEQGKFSKLKERATQGVREVAASGLSRLGAEHASEYLREQNSVEAQARTIISSPELQPMFAAQRQRRKSALQHEARGDDLSTFSKAASSLAGGLGTIAGHVANAVTPGTGTAAKAGTKAALQSGAALASHLASKDFGKARSEHVEGMTLSQFETEEGRQAGKLDVAKWDQARAKQEQSKQNRNRAGTTALQTGVTAGIGASHQDPRLKELEKKAAGFGLNHLGDASELAGPNKKGDDVKAANAALGRTYFKAYRRGGGQQVLRDKGHVSKGRSDIETALRAGPSRRARTAPSSRSQAHHNSESGHSE